MFISIIAFCAGLVVWMCIAKLIAIQWLLCAIIIGIFLIYFLPFKKKPLYIVWIAFFIGFSYANFRAHQLLHWHLSAKLINKPVHIEGYITSLPRISKYSSHFNFYMNRLNGNPVAVHIYLGWFGHYPVLQVGDRWHLSVKLKPPHGLRNPGTFNYERWLVIRGIRATGNVISKKPNYLLQHDFWRFPINHLRQRIQSIIQHAVISSALRAILNTLTTGSRSLMAPSQWQVFQNTGTSHLMAISGLHVGLIAGIIYFVAGFLWRLFPSLLLRIPANRIAAIASLLAAILYGLLAGFSIPTQRAVIMITVLMLGSFFLKSVPVSQRLLLAFFMVVLWQPFALWSSSFWLSFTAVAWIGYGMGGRIQTLRGLKATLRLQLIIFIGLLPLTFYFFQQISMVSLIANTIAIPWVGMVIVPLCFFATLMSLFFVKFSHLLFYLAAKLLTPLWWWLQWLSSWPHAVWHYAISPVWVLISFVVATVLLLSPSGWPGRWTGMIWLLPVFFWKTPAPKPGAIWLTMLDVGQGLAAVIRTTHHVLLYDTGPHTYAGFDAGQEIVVPYFQSRRLQGINIMMISHGDNDHSGGANAVLARIPVERVLTSVPARFTSGAMGCVAGQAWVWDNVTFQVLSPSGGEAYEDNNSSCVLKISNRKGVVLLTGDIEKIREQKLLRRGYGLRADVMIAPHHGSITSSSLAFIKAVSPKVVLFPVGYYNRYNLPSRQVVARYRSLGVHVYSSAQDGAITVRIDLDGKIHISTMNKTGIFNGNIRP